MALTVSANPVDPYGLGQLYPYVLPSSGGAPATGSSTGTPSSTGSSGNSGYYYDDSASSAASTAAANAAAASQYDQSIGNTQAAINRLGGQLSSGDQAIDSSYTDALNQLLSGKNQANATYDTNKQQTASDFVSGKNTVRSEAGTSLNSLERILGSRGAGGSSAATITAPGAVARNATIQQNGLTSTFGENNQALDTNWGNYMTGYNNQVASAGSQRDQQKQSLQQQIDQNKASLLQSLATLAGQKASVSGGSATGAAQPFLDQANQVLDASSNYSTAPINYQVQAYTAPNLSQYTVNPNAAPTYNGQSSTDDYVSPYLAALLGSASTKKDPNATPATPVPAGS